MQVVCEEFKTRVDIYNKKSLFRFFMRYAFFSTNDLALILGLSPGTIQEYKRYAGIKRKDGPYHKPVNHNIPVHLDLPENWDTPEWWRAHYPRYGMYILTRETGLNYNTVRRRVRQHCGRIRGHKEAVQPDHPCCNKDWLRKHYINQGLNQKQCGLLAGVSDSTIRSWLVRLGFQVRGHNGGSLLDQVGGIRAS